MANAQVSVLGKNNASSEPSRVNPAESRVNPAESRVNPAESRANPAESRANAAENNASSEPSRVNAAENLADVSFSAGISFAYGKCLRKEATGERSRNYCSKVNPVASRDNSEQKQSKANVHLSQPGEKQS